MAAHLAPPSLGFSRKEHWSELSFPPPMHESKKWKWSRSVGSDSSNPMDCSLPGSSVHGIFQARVLEWGAILHESERGEWKSWLKTQHSENEDHDIGPHQFMANRWGNSENSDRLYTLGSKITANGDCSHEIKIRLLLGRKVMTNLDSLLKNRDITLPSKIHLVKAMVFPVVMYGWES